MTLPSCKAPSIVGFPIFSHDFQRWFFPHSDDFSYISHIFPMISHIFPRYFRFSYDFSWFSYDFPYFPMIFLWFPICSIHFSPGFNGAPSVSDVELGGSKPRRGEDVVTTCYNYSWLYSHIHRYIWATVKTPAILNMYSTDIGLWKLMEIVKNTR